MSTKKNFFKTFLLIAILLFFVMFFYKTALASYIISKLNDYSDYTVRGTGQTIVGIIQFAMVLKMASSRESRDQVQGKEYSCTMIGLSIINLFSFSNYQMILRFGNAMIIGSSVIYMSLYKKEHITFNMHKCRTFELVIFLASTLVFAYTMIYYYNNFLS